MDKETINNFDGGSIVTLQEKNYLQCLSGNIASCIESINKQADQANAAKNLTGPFKGKVRDLALADALVSSSETQVQIIKLIQETIKLFFCCFNAQEERTASQNEDIFNLIISQTENEDTKKFLNEVGEVFVSYQDSIRSRINLLATKIDEHNKDIKQKLHEQREESSARSAKLSVHVDMLERRFDKMKSKLIVSYAIGGVGLLAGVVSTIFIL